MGAVMNNLSGKEKKGGGGGKSGELIAQYRRNIICSCGFYSRLGWPNCPISAKYHYFVAFTAV